VIRHGPAAFDNLGERRLELPRVLFTPRPRGDVVTEDPSSEPVRDIQLPAEAVDLLVLRRSPLTR